MILDKAVEYIMDYGFSALTIGSSITAGVATEPAIVNWSLVIGFTGAFCAIVQVTLATINTRINMKNADKIDKAIEDSKKKGKRS